MISERYQAINAAIQEAEKLAGVAPGTVNLLAVSKRQPAEKVRALYALGQRHFAENRVLEAVAKKQELQDIDLVWHFIGRIQSRKHALIAQHFSWVHSLCRASDAAGLAFHRGALELPPLQVCVQVNISNDEAKSGVLISQVQALCEKISQHPQLQLRGLMTILARELFASEVEAAYGELAQLQASLNQAGFQLDALSMGMTGDYPLAIGQGANWVRLGTALFGERVL